MTIRFQSALTAFITLCFLLLPAWARDASAYGPATHIGEALAYLEDISINPLPGPRGDYELLSDPDNLMHLKLGSIWPDLMRVWPDVNFEPHDHGLAVWLIDRAASQPEEWKLGLAVGNLNHVSGDLVGQDMATQYYGVKGRWGDLDVIAGMQDDRPGGEKEGLLEIGLEIMRADLSQYIELAQYFLADISEPDPMLLRIIDWYLSEAAVYYGSDREPGDGPAALESITAALERPANQASWGSALDPNAPAVLRLSDGLPMMLWDDPKADGVGIHWDEFIRVLTGPLTEPDFFDDYYTLFQPLTVIADRQMGGPADLWEGWPNWDARMNIGGSVASLMSFLPEIYSDQAAIMVSQAKWIDLDTGGTIASFESSSPPSNVRAQVELFVCDAVEQDLILRVRKDEPGFDYDGDPVIAQSGFTLTADPMDYGSTPRQTCYVDFSPGPYLENARGFTLEVALDDDEAKALFTTSFDQMEGITEANVFTPNYDIKWDSYAKQWPDGLKVDNPIFTTDQGDLSGRVIELISNLGVEDAEVDVLESGLSGPTNSRGRFAIDRIGSGEHTVAAVADGYTVGGAVVQIDPGGWTRQDIYVTRIPVVDDGGPYSVENGDFLIRWDAPVGDVLDRYEVALGTAPAEADILPWRDAGRALEFHVMLDEPLEDGVKFYGNVRAVIDGYENQAGAGDGCIVDSSPPLLDDLIELSDPGDGWGRQARFEWQAEDPHSGLKGQWIALGSAPESMDLLGWTAADGAFEFVPAEFAESGPIYLTVMAVNNAGLSAFAQIEVIGSQADDDGGQDSGSDEEKCCGM